MKHYAHILGLIFLAFFMASAFAQTTGTQYPSDFTSYGYPSDYPFNYILKNKFQLSGPAMFDFRFLSRYIPNGKPNILEEGICVDDACYCKVRYGLHTNTSHVLPRDYQIYITHHNSASDYSAPRGSHKGLYMDCGQSVYPPNPYYPGEKQQSYVPQGNAYSSGQYGTPYSWSVAYDYLRNQAGNLLKPQAAYTYGQFYGYGQSTTGSQANKPVFNQYTRDQAYDWSYPINNTYNAYQAGSAYQGPYTIGNPAPGQGGYRTTYQPGYTYP